MQTTNIEWTEMSVNPFRARREDITMRTRSGHYCEKVSAGCANCYASAMQVRFQMPTFPEARKAMPDLYLDEAKLMEVLRRKKPTKIFWCDMTDMFAEFYPDEWIDKCFAVMALTPQHTHQVLTKRPERMREYMMQHTDGLGGDSVALRVFDQADQIRQTYKGRSDLPPDVSSYVTPWPLLNVWLGVSVEDQPSAIKRIPDLMNTPAAVRFVSYEPALGPLDLGYFAPCDHPRHTHKDVGCWAGLDWIIVGGESGAKARPFNIQWARGIVAQCKAAGVACFVKQLGSRPQGEFHPDGPFEPVLLLDRKGGDPSEWPEDLRVREFPEGSR